MSFYDSVLKRALFRLDPERAHHLAFWFLRRGLVRAKSFQHPLLEQELFGVRFGNPLGLAAGFDKNAEALDHWHKLGFGFVEAGTVTYHQQPGNPKPRLFRLPADRALINRMGFNNDGAEAVSARVRRSKARVPLGINLGKSKVTDLDQAAADYARSFGLLKDLGDYFVINVSSPNTPGLRGLQARESLAPIVWALQEIDSTRPLFVKIAPDLTDREIDGIVALAHEMSLKGLIATNTTIGREGLATRTDEAGGLSGAPLRVRSNEVLKQLHRNCDPGMILIGVGGIFTGDDLYEKIACGAHLAQIYTGWIYGGPSTAPRVLAGLASRLEREGTTLQEIRGSATQG